MNYNKSTRRAIIISIIVVSALGLAFALNRDQKPKPIGPVFMDIQAAKAELRPTYWGSEGWFIVLPSQSAYLYASLYPYMIRYDLSANTIDRAVKWVSPSDDYLEIKWRFTPDGIYALVCNTLDKNYTYNPKDIFFLDFNDGKILYSASSLDDLHPDKLPANLRDGFDIETLQWNDDNSYNVENLNFTLAVEYNPNTGSFLYAYDKSGQKHEITILRNSLVSNELPYVVVDSETIGSIVPKDEESSAFLGYYRFVLIDVANNKIIQECPINTGLTDCF